MGRLLEHLAAVTPPGGLVGVGVRHLREPTGARGDYRSMGPFAWVDPADFDDVADSFERRLAHPDVAGTWRWVHEAGGPEHVARRHHLHGEKPPGALMLRCVYATAPPENGGGRLDELAGVTGLPVDVDVAERRPGDTRRYCPTVVAAVDLLGGLGASVILDAGGGVVGVWLLEEPADPQAARRLGADVVASVGELASSRGWAFDSPAPHSAWTKFPDVTDCFRRHVTRELETGPAWTFAELRAVVPSRRRGGPTRWNLQYRQTGLPL